MRTVTFAKEGYPDRPLKMSDADILLLQGATHKRINIDGKPFTVRTVALRLDTTGFEGRVAVRLEVD